VAKPLEVLKISSAAHLVSVACNRLQLLRYLSAFSKEERGGSFFLGLKGKKTLEWHSGPTAFLCEGIELPYEKNFHEDLQENLDDTISSLMWWYPGYPNNRPMVQVHLHQVWEDAQLIRKCYVVEIFVRKFAGVFFTDPLGPEAYEYPQDHPSDEPTRIQREEWIKRQLQAANELWSFLPDKLFNPFPRDSNTDSQQKAGECEEHGPPDEATEIRKCKNICTK
jgi:hypothetical protein